VNSTGVANTSLGQWSGVSTAGLSNTISLGACAQAQVSGEIALGSVAHPLACAATALGAYTGHLCVRINGTLRKLAFYA
jgi:hypothetical protein